MFDDALAPLIGTTFRTHDKAELEELLCLPNARQVVQSSSFEQLFFSIKVLGLGDALGLLPLVTQRQVCGFVDLDCWRKDSFVRKPFLEWVAAFIQVGSEETANALSGIDEYVIALFLKDVVRVYELERDEPLPGTQLITSPDNRLAVQLEETGEPATIAALILDVLFCHVPDLGYRVLRLVRYTTRTVLEETAYQNKLRRLDVHGFVDYFEALSIYGGSPIGVPPDRPSVSPEIDSEELEAEPPQFLPTVFAESISGDGFLLSALAALPQSASETVAQELTALGNRILSANLVNLGEVEGIRVALGEMRDFLTIGLEILSAGNLAAAGQILVTHHAQNVFKVGFDQVASLRDLAEGLARFPGFFPDLLESPDKEFCSGLLRFKPLLWEDARYRNFQSMEDVEDARERMQRIRLISEGFLRIFPSSKTTLRRTFNTAVIQLAASGEFSAEPIDAQTLSRFLSEGITYPELNLPEELHPIAQRWLGLLKQELTPLVGKPIDPRYIDFVLMA
jgi:hypothetical protein